MLLFDERSCMIQLSSVNKTKVCSWEVSVITETRLYWYDGTNKKFFKTIVLWTCTSPWWEMDRWWPLCSLIERGCVNLDVDKERSLLEHMWYVAPVSMMKDKCGQTYVDDLYTLKNKMCKGKRFTVRIHGSFHHWWVNKTRNKWLNNFLIE